MLILWVSLLLASLLQTPITEGVTVRGRVTPSSSPAISGTGRVALIGPGVTRTESAVSADGSFEFQKVRPGTYRVTSTPGTQSQTVTIIVADKNILDLELVNPRTFDVMGNVVVENGGLRPSIILTLSPYSGGFGIGTAAVLPTGAFTASLAEGDYRISWSGLPEGYIVRSIVAGSVDLLSKPLSVMGTTVPPITLTLGVSSPPPWVKVSGRVVGLRATAATPTISLSGGNTVTQTVQARINADGTFEFPMVLPGTYSARIVPIPPVSPPNMSVYVGRKDVEGLQILIPVMKCVPGRAVVEGDGPIPNLNFALGAPPPNQTTTLSVFPPDHGQFGILLPEGEQRIILTTLLPSGYSLKSFTYGSTDLLRSPLSVASTDSQLLLTFAAAPGSWAKVSGKVTGIDATARTYRVTTSGLRPLQANVQADGSFSFEKVLRGNYTLGLTSLGGLPASKTIAVTGQDITGLEFVAPSQKEVLGHVTTEGGGQRYVSFTLVLRGSAGSVGINVSAGADGNFKIALPEGESQVSVSGMPANAVQSLTYGGVDLLKSPLRVARGDTAELEVRVAPGTVGAVLGGILDSGPSSCTPSGALR